MQFSLIFKEELTSFVLCLTVMFFSGLMTLINDNGHMLTIINVINNQIQLTALIIFYLNLRKDAILKFFISYLIVFSISDDFY